MILYAKDGCPICEGTGIAKNRFGILKGSTCDCAFEGLSREGFGQANKAEEKGELEILPAAGA